MRECDISAAATAGPMRGGLGPRGAVIGRAGGIWRVLAISTNGESRVTCRDSVSWQRVRPSAQVDFRRMNRETVIGHLAATRPYKGKHAGSSAHLKVGLHSGNMYLWTSEEKEEEKRRRRLKSRKKTKEEEEEARRRRLRSNEED